MSYVRQRQDGDAQFVRDLINLKVRASQLGLFQTMHALDGATQMVGWEIVNATEAGARYRKAKDRQAERARRA